MRDQQPEPVSLGAAEKPSEEVLLNRYRVLARRGTGGFGTVCTCWDTWARPAPPAFWPTPT